MARSLFYVFFLFMLTNCSMLGMKGCSKNTETQPPAETNVTADNNTNENETKTETLPNQENKKMFAIFNTNKGKIKAELFPNMAPKTVENFVGLAEGTKEFTDPKTGEKAKRPFYDGLTFHRVIPNFMVQAGCPLGTGTGGPGYKFNDEFHPELKHDKKGVLSMANAGPNTNGSQFFITVAPTPHLDQNRSRGQGYSIFGQVVEGQDIADSISKVATDAYDKPNEAVIIEKVEIVRE